MLQLPFADIGSILVIGPDAQMQGLVARQYAAQHLADGGSVIALVEYEGEGRTLISACVDILRGLGSNTAALDRLHIFSDVRHYRTSDELIMALKRHAQWFRGATPLLLRDMAGYMADTLPGASWFGHAEEVALLLDCQVITAGQWGSLGRPSPDILKYQADEVWRASAGLNLSLTLERVKPIAAKVTLAGKVAPHSGAVIFGNAEAREFSHV